jgi:hypothetical protein
VFNATPVATPVRTTETLATSRSVRPARRVIHSCSHQRPGAWRSAPWATTSWERRPATLAACLAKVAQATSLTATSVIQMGHLQPFTALSWRFLARTCQELLAGASALMGSSLIAPIQLLSSADSASRHAQHVRAVLLAASLAMVMGIDITFTSTSATRSVQRLQPLI